MNNIEIEEKRYKRLAVRIDRAMDASEILKKYINRFMEQLMNHIPTNYAIDIKILHNDSGTIKEIYTRKYIGNIDKTKFKPYDGNDVQEKLF